MALPASLVVLLFVSPLSAQLVVKCTPIAPNVVTASVANAHGLSQYQIHVINVGQSARTIPSFVYLDVVIGQSLPTASVQIPFIDSIEAQQILQAAVKRSIWGILADVGEYATTGVAFGNAVAKGNKTVTIVTGSIGIGIPLLQALIAKHSPTTTAMGNQATYPVTIQPGGAFADYQFATLSPHKKGTSPLAPVVVTIP